MALGDLSAGQRSYRDRVAAGTGLDRTVVTAWIGAESGWGVTKPDHNYLNVGPGRSYPSVAAAADAVVSLIRSSSHYAGIRAAIPRGASAQVEAIATSPWDAGRYGGDGSRLRTVHDQLTGRSSSGDTPTATPVGWTDNRVLPWNWGETAGEAIGSVARPFAQVLEAASDRVLAGTLTVVFVLAGLTLIGFGVVGLTAPRSGLPTSTLTGG
jgi:hypothetical protein